MGRSDLGATPFRLSKVLTPSARLVIQHESLAGFLAEVTCDRVEAEVATLLVGHQRDFLVAAVTQIA